MSIIAYPLEATEYTAEDVQSYLSTRTSGVYSEDITFTPKGMTVTVSPFLAWFNYAKFKGCSVAVTEPEILTFSPAHAVLDRIDRIVLRVDFTVNKAYFTVIEGNPSSSPVPNDISKTEAINDISPVYVRIRAGATEITPADITSTILDESVCGIMRDGVTGIPTSQLQTQTEALILRLHNAITEVQSNSAFMIGEVYDPHKKSKEMAFKDETPVLGQNISDCNTAVDTGSYVCSLGCENTPNGEIFRYASLEAVRRNNAVYQTITYLELYAKRYASSIDDGATWTWSDWEWANPPMELGVVYKTTKRYNGKAVYTVLQNLGNLPAKGKTKTVYVASGSGITPINYLTVQFMFEGGGRLHCGNNLFSNDGNLLCRGCLIKKKTLELTSFAAVTDYTVKVLTEYTLN